MIDYYLESDSNNAFIDCRIQCILCTHSSVSKLFYCFSDSMHSNKSRFSRIKIDFPFSHVLRKTQKFSSKEMLLILCLMKCLGKGIEEKKGLGTVEGGEPLIK